MLILPRKGVVERCSGFWVAFFSISITDADGAHHLLQLSSSFNVYFVIQSFHFTTVNVDSFYNGKLQYSTYKIQTLVSLGVFVSSQCPSSLYNVVTCPPYFCKGGHIHRALLLGGHPSVVINIMIFLYALRTEINLN